MRFAPLPMLSHSQLSTSKGVKRINYNCFLYLCLLYGSNFIPIQVNASECSHSGSLISTNNKYLKTLLTFPTLSIIGISWSYTLSRQACKKLK